MVFLSWHKERISFGQSHLPIEYGGLNFKNFDTQCKSLFISTLLNQYLNNENTFNGSVIEYWFQFNLRKFKTPSSNPRRYMLPYNLCSSHFVFNNILKEIDKIENPSDLNPCSSKILYNYFIQSKITNPKI